MRSLKAIYYFHLKLIIPSLTIGLIVGSLGDNENDFFFHPKYDTWILDSFIIISSFHL